MLSARMDFQDAMAAGVGVTEYARGSKAAKEIATLWNWTRAQLERSQSSSAAHRGLTRQTAA
jgi:chromosome partitioning protein